MCKQRYRTPNLKPVGAWRSEGRRLWGRVRMRGLCGALSKHPVQGRPAGTAGLPSDASLLPAFCSISLCWCSQPLGPLLGWDTPHPLRGTVWPPFNLGANPPFKPFPVKARVRSLRFTVLFWSLSSSASNFGTWSCLYCWGRAISSETGLDHLLL